MESLCYDCHMEIKEKKCTECGTVFNNIRSDGRFMYGKQFKNRNFCSSACSVKNRNKNKFIEKKEKILMYDNNANVCYVDKENISNIKTRYWSMSKNGYWVSYQREKGQKRKTLLLSRILTNAPDGKYVDHINRNTSDNRITNLRIVDPSINSVNKDSVSSNTGYLGVYKLKRRGYYRAEISFRGNKRTITSKNLETVIRKRKQWEKEFGWDKMKFNYKE